MFITCQGIIYCGVFGQLNAVYKSLKFTMEKKRTETAIPEYKCAR